MQFSGTPLDRPPISSAPYLRRDILYPQLFLANEFFFSSFFPPLFISLLIFLFLFLYQTTSTPDPKLDPWKTQDAQDTNVYP